MVASDNFGEDIEVKQIREFWEWCGLRYTEPYWLDAKGELAFYGLTYSQLLGSIDLNNLFKYAVPKLDIEKINIYPATKDRWRCYFDNWYQDHNVAETPALALFWAIWKVIKDGNA